jgi:cytosine/adenosine deaminase-related metal-dependent hydrolase
MKRVFDNAIILQGEELEEVHGYVVVKEGVIEEIGEGSYLGSKEDVKRGIISPSFTNAHVHVGDSAGKDLGTYLSIGERVGREGVKFEIHKSAESKNAMAETLERMRAGGTTAFCDFREGGVNGISKLTSVLNMPARILGRPLGDEDIMQSCDGLGISSIKDYSHERLNRILRARSGKLVGVHSSEVTDDITDVLKIDPDFLVHLTNAEEASLKKVFTNKIPIVLCPRANASFGAGIPELKLILESECLLALGTDNVMANSISMFREMEFLFKLFRGHYKDHNFDARTVLKMATIQGRKLLNLPDNTIKEGNKADFIITRKIEYSNDPVLSLVHRSEACDVKEVVSPASKADI